MSTIFHELDLPRRPKASANVATLPGAPPRTLDGRLFSKLSEFEMEVEIMKRRILGVPPIPGTEMVVRGRN